MPSSVVANIIYNEQSAALRVVFVSGAVYEYKNVPPAIYLSMKTAASKGTYLNTQIKGHFRCKKIK